jgi:hypothetical protein
MLRWHFDNCKKNPKKQTLSKKEAKVESKLRSKLTSDLLVKQYGKHLRAQLKSRFLPNG